MDSIGLARSRQSAKIAAAAVVAVETGDEERGEGEVHFQSRPVEEEEMEELLRHSTASSHEGSIFVSDDGNESSEDEDDEEEVSAADIIG